ncbi:MAG: TIGR03032 family protein [Caulobacter sp.]|nr:TIGR03032 family protein [Caulobacter sp.]
MTDASRTAATPALKPAAAGPLLLLSPGFSDWLAGQGASLALTTYQAGRLVMVGRRPDGTVRAHERMIEQCQGLWTDGQSLWTSGMYALWRFENDMPAGAVTPAGVDRRFVPREGRITGRIDCHDIGLGQDGPIFVNTLFNGLCGISETGSFRPLWKPPFISAWTPEDRCHLNGLAMEGTRPAYVSAVSRSDTLDGWRERRVDGGVIVDVDSGEIVCSGLSMPHSPRLYDDRLWVLNSGRGQFGQVDPATGVFTPVAFCPGYARGLAFIGRHAVIGLSRPRNNQTFAGLPLDEELAARDATPRCGLIIVNIDTGVTEEWLRFAHTLDELYDVAVMPGVTQPEMVGFQGDAIKAAITPEPAT